MRTDAIDPAKAIRLARTLGKIPHSIVVLGCEPSPLRDSDDVTHGLSAAVSRAVEQAADLIEPLVASMRESAGTDGADAERSGSGDG